MDFCDKLRGMGCSERHVWNQTRASFPLTYKPASGRHSTKLLLETERQNKYGRNDVGAIHIIKLFQIKVGVTQLLKR